MKTLTLGILGGGQLGRMSAMAAARLGIPVIIYSPEEGSPAAQVASECIVGAYEDQARLSDFASKVDVISYEFENIPVETISYLKTLKPVYPDENLLEIAQDRIKEKTFLNEHGIETAKWKEIHSTDDIRTFLKGISSKQCIIKTARFGYDGKGQAKVDESNIEETLRIFEGHSLIAEEIVDFDCEVSIIISRDSKGKIVTYGPVRNEHKNHILSRSYVPANIPAELSQRAVQKTTDLACAFNLIGVLALEMFVTKDGRILANEIAPRTHNSGHWTIDACNISEFEQHVRSVCDIGVGAMTRHSDAEMINLIGQDVLSVDKYLDQENACVHLYGKQEIRDGRKLGHVTILKEKS